MTHSVPLNSLLTESKAAELLGVSVKTLQAWRCRQPGLLPHVKLGRAVRYRMEDLTDFIERSLVRSNHTSPIAN